MKEYFKYANGFVNLNGENLFLTNSGNWSETLNLLEKSPKSIRQNNFKGLKIYIYYLLIISIIGFGIYDVIFGILKDIKNKSFPFGVVLIVLGILAYLKRDKGKRYKIPTSKIINIVLHENEAIIHFYNANGIEDSEKLTNVEAKGMEILSQWKPINS